MATFSEPLTLTVIANLKIVGYYTQPAHRPNNHTLLQVDPSLLGLPPNAGEAPSKGFVTLPSCRSIPGASVSLASRPAATIPLNASGTGNPGGGGVEEVLEVSPPPGSRGKTLELRVLDPISLRVRLQSGERRVSCTCCSTIFL